MDTLTAPRIKTLLAGALLVVGGLAAAALPGVVATDVHAATTEEFAEGPSLAVPFGGQVLRPAHTSGLVPVAEPAVADAAAATNPSPASYGQHSAGSHVPRCGVAVGPVAC